MACMFYFARCMNIIFNSLLAQLVKYEVYYLADKPAKFYWNLKLRVISDDDLFSELYRTLRLGKKFRNFVELYIKYDEMEQLWWKKIICVLVYCSD